MRICLSSRRTSVLCIVVSGALEMLPRDGDHNAHNFTASNTSCLTRVMLMHSWLRFECWMRRKLTEILHYVIVMAGQRFSMQQTDV